MTNGDLVRDLVPSLSFLFPVHNNAIPICGCDWIIFYFIFVGVNIDIYSTTQSLNTTNILQSASTFFICLSRILDEAPAMLLHVFIQ